MYLVPPPFKVAIVIKGMRTNTFDDYPLRVSDTYDIVEPATSPNSDRITTGDSGEAEIQHDSTLWVAKTKPSIARGSLYITSRFDELVYSFNMSSVVFYSYETWVMVPLEG